MPSWKLHKQWAKKLGINEDISEKVDKIIDSEGGDLRGTKLLSKLEKEKLLNENTKNETVKSVTLHNIMDCLRDLIWELGSEPVSLTPPEELLKIAHGMCVDRDYILLAGRPGIKDFEDIVKALEVFSGELVGDIVEELTKKGLRKVGIANRINKKYVKWLMENYPELREYKKTWDYSKLTKY